MKLDPVAHRVERRGRQLQIGPTEYRLLYFFMTHPERVYSRAQLLDHVWDENADPFTYVGCHYVDLVYFITGLRPVEVSVVVTVTARVKSTFESSGGVIVRPSRIVAAVGKLRNTNL